MIKYVEASRSTCVTEGLGVNQGWTPWVYLFPSIILNKPYWGTLTIL